MTMTLKHLFFILILFLFSSAIVFAGYDYRFENRENPMGQYESETSAKLTRGVTNIAYGWTELFRTPADWAAKSEHRIWSALAVGIPYGMIRVGARTLIGVYETVTCYAPQKPIMSDIQGEVV